MLLTVMILANFEGMIFATYISGNLFLGAASPLFFEMACEVTYPVAEGVTTLVLTLINNIAGLVFLLIQVVPGIGRSRSICIYCQCTCSVTFLIQTPFNIRKKVLNIDDTVYRGIVYMLPQFTVYFLE